MQMADGRSLRCALNAHRISRCPQQGQNVLFKWFQITKAANALVSISLVKKYPLSQMDVLISIKVGQVSGFRVEERIYLAIKADRMHLAAWGRRLERFCVIGFESVNGGWFQTSDVQGERDVTIL